MPAGLPARPMVKTFPQSPHFRFPPLRHVFSEKQCGHSTSARLWDFAKCRAKRRNRSPHTGQGVPCLNVGFTIGFVDADGAGGVWCGCSTTGATVSLRVDCSTECFAWMWASSPILILPQKVQTRPPGLWIGRRAARFGVVALIAEASSFCGEATKLVGSFLVKRWISDGLHFSRCS